MTDERKVWSVISFLPSIIWIDHGAKIIFTENPTLKEVLLNGCRDYSLKSLSKTFYGKINEWN